MTPERWQRVKELLAPALELEPAKRTSYLDQVCVEDPSLRPELERLLAAEQRAGADFLNNRDIPGELIQSIPLHGEPWIGRRLGPYQIIEEIGAGGMGAVYRAVRADGQYNQQVALKIVRADLGSLSAERFRAERQILAGLDHPNIARILDGGATADGLPYLVMELIDGVPITNYCDRHKLSINDRLKMFRVVCSAVHYAHQHLIIHRDIKPANIIVTAEGIPKLLDFGIAKILDPNLLPENLSLTATGVWMMTPEYASPEQFRGEAITTATDVYSLGLVLYELLTGWRAYRFPSHMPHEVARIVLETDPERPSTAVRRQDEVAERRGTEKVPATAEFLSGLRATSPEKLQQRIRGDLDNIVLRAIRKEPRERYSSVDQLSEDIRRHLEHLPVMARKSTLTYRCRKYVLRHKVGVAAAALVFLSLLTGIVLTLREARIANRRFNDVRKLANSLMFEVHDSIRDLPGATAARKLIIQRAQEYLDSLAQDAKADPGLLRELAAAYGRLASVQGNPRDVNVGDTAKAVQNYRKAAELLERSASLEPGNAETLVGLAQTYLNLGMSLEDAGDKNGFKENLQKALQILESSATSNPEDQKMLFVLADAYTHRGFAFGHDGDAIHAINYHEKALGIYQRLAKLDPKNDQYQTGISFAHKRIAAFLADQAARLADPNDQLSRALNHEQAALEIDQAQLAVHPDSVRARFNITFTYSDTGYILGKQGDIEGALRHYRKALEIRRTLVKDDPNDMRAKEGLSNTHSYIAGLLRQKEDLAGALASYKESLALRQSLSEKDTANENLRFKAAQSESGIGDVYAAMAFRPGVASTDALGYCRESEKWNRKALPVWLQMKAEGKVAGSDLEAIPRIKENVDRCSRLVARLSRLPQPSPH